MTVETLLETRKQNYPMQGFKSHEVEDVYLMAYGLLHLERLLPHSEHSMNICHMGIFIIHLRRIESDSSDKFAVDSEYSRWET